MLLPPFPSVTTSSSAAEVSYNAELLSQLTDSIHPKLNWIIAGHSMGAALAGAMASSRPNQVIKICLVDGTFGDIRKSNRINISGWFISSGPVKQLAEVIAKKRFYNYSKFKELLKSAYSQEPDSISVIGYLEPFKIKRSASAILEMSRSREIKNLTADSIHCPVLVIWGRKDTWIPLENGEKFIQKHPSFTFRIIETAGHCSMEINSKEFNSL